MIYCGFPERMTIFQEICKLLFPYKLKPSIPLYYNNNCFSTLIISQTRRKLKVLKHIYYKSLIIKCTLESYLNFQDMHKAPKKCTSNHLSNFPTSS